MKKIILYSSTQLEKIRETGGVKRLKELARNLSNYCDFTLLSGDEELSFLDQSKHISMHHIRLSRKEFEYAIWNRKYLRFIKKQGYDYLISFDVPPTIWLVLLGMPHICLMVRKDLIGYEKIIQEGKTHNIKNWVISHLKIEALSLAELITLIGSEKVIVQCEYDKNVILERHIIFRRVIQNKFRVQINNVNPSWIKKSFSNSIHTENNNEFVIGSINGFGDLRKGCDLFLDASYQLIKTGENVRAYIAGDGPLMNEYKEKYRNCDRIVFLGRINNPTEFLKRLNLSVVPSRADSCPNTIMESLYNNIPVIASRSGGIPEILPFDEALFDLSVDSIVKRIKELIHNSNKLEVLGELELTRKKELEFNWCYEVFKNF